MNFLTWLGFNKLMDDTDPNNVIKLPTAPRLVPPIPESEQQARIYYRIGVTDNNRVSFQLTVGEVTMDKLGVENLILGNLHDRK